MASTPQNYSNITLDEMTAFIRILKLHCGAHQPQMSHQYLFCFVAMMTKQDNRSTEHKLFKIVSLAVPVKLQYLQQQYYETAMAML